MTLQAICCGVIGLLLSGWLSWVTLAEDWWLLSRRGRAFRLLVVPVIGLLCAFIGLIWPGVVLVGAVVVILAVLVIALAAL